jgi:hypothetical protein
MIINNLIILKKSDSSHVSNSNKFFFCCNDVQAIDFLRKGSYVPDSIPTYAMMLVQLSLQF